MSIANLFSPNDYDIFCDSITATSLNTEAIGVTSITSPNNFLLIAPDLPNTGPVTPPPAPVDVVIQRQGGVGLGIRSDYDNNSVGVMGLLDITDSSHSGGLAFSRTAFGQVPANSIMLLTADSKPGLAIRANGHVFDSDVVLNGPLYAEFPLDLNNTATRCLSKDGNNKIIEKDLSTVFDQTLNTFNNVTFQSTFLRSLTLTELDNDDTQTQFLTADINGFVTYKNQSSFIDSGFFNSTWTTISGFTGGPTNNFTMIWNKVGNVVSVNFWADPPNPAIGSNVATFTLPVPRLSNFATNNQLNGSCEATDSRLSSSRLEADTGTTDTGILTLIVTASGAVTIEGQFSYYLL